MPIKTTLIAMILATLSVVAVMYVLRLETPERAAGDVAGAGTPLSALGRMPVDEVDRISLTRADEATMAFKRDEGRWMQVEPFTYPMDLFSIHQMADLAGRLADDDMTLPVGRTGDDQDAALGFDPPRAVIRFEWGNGETLTLQLGRLVGAGRAYLRVMGDERVYSVDHSLHQRAIQMDPREWRERRIFTNVSVDADAIERTVRSDHLALRRDKRRWSIVEPIPARVSQAALESWLRGVDGAKLAAFIIDQPEDLAQFGLDQPEASLTLTTTRTVSIDDQSYPEQVTQRLLVGDRIGGSTQDRFAMREGWPVVFRLSVDTQFRIFPQLVNMVDPTATDVMPSDIKALAIQTSESDLHFERDLERWLATERTSTTVESKYVLELLQQITELQPQRVVIDQYPLDRHVANIILYGFNRKPLTTVRVAKSAEGEWILENGDNILRYFPASLHLRLADRDFGLVSP